MTIMYKLTEDGKSILMDEKGLPVVFDEKEGKEFGLDAIHLFTKIPALQEEAKTHRLNAKTLADKLALYGTIEPNIALEAIETVKALSVGDLKKKEEVDLIKKETEEAWNLKLVNQAKSYEERVKAQQELVQKREDDLRKSLLGSNFARSQFFSGKTPITTLTPEIAEAYFGKHFRVNKDELGNMSIVGQHKGADIYSRKRPGEFADFDEAMEKIIEAYPHKETILQKSLGSSALGSLGLKGKVVSSADQKGFLDNIAAIAKGDVIVQS
jgi:hypothetical protein